MRYLSPWSLPLLAGIAAMSATAAAGQESHQVHHMTGNAARPAAGKVPLYKNLGRYSRKITTPSRAAQQYFDQGLRLTYAFNHDEAINSFHTAIAHDSSCAMCWWGVANALGPNINAPMDTSAVKPAHEAIGRARQLAAGATPVEQAIIGATAARYTATPVANRAPLDSAYASAMRSVAQRFPKDPDAQTLYAEALMDLTPWNYWTDRGRTARPGTDEVIRTLERAVKANPNHPGACHFYIHIVEASTDPARAVPCAERLAKLVPGAGHLVHMPTHIYMRTGRYDLVAAHNHDAVHEDEQFIQDRRPTGFYQFTYYPHNYHMMWAGLMMLGRGDKALEAARKIVSIVPADVTLKVPPLEYFMPTPYFSLARFGRWDELLAEPAPRAELKYTMGMWHYTRGLAHAAKGRPAEAQAELDKVTAITTTIPAEQPAGINSARALLGVAQQHLGAKVALQRGDTARAIATLLEAVRAEDALTYDEPPAWYHPLRHELGALYLAADRPVDAERTFRDDLAYWPENGWALSGLAKSLHAQGKHAEAAAVDRRLRKAWGKMAATPP
jgi:tetratricopeptide (TPR) repeat protein